MPLIFTQRTFNSKPGSVNVLSGWGDQQLLRCKVQTAAASLLYKNAICWWVGTTVHNTYRRVTIAHSLFSWLNTYKLQEHNNYSAAKKRKIIRNKWVHIVTRTKGNSAFLCNHLFILHVRFWISAFSIHVTKAKLQPVCLLSNNAKARQCRTNDDKKRMTI